MFPPLKPSRLKALLLLAATAALLGCQKAPTPYNTTLKTGDVMRQIIDPAAVELWKNAGEADTLKGVEYLAPTTDEGWNRVAVLSAIVAEGSNSLMLPGRVRALKKGDADWTQFAQDLGKQALASRDAARAHDSKKLYETGATLYQACVNCHTKYLLPFLDKNGQSKAPGAPGSSGPQ